MPLLVQRSTICSPVLLKTPVLVLDPWAVHCTRSIGMAPERPPR